MIEWHVVVLKRGLFATASSPRGTFPVPALGARCVCCNTDTEQRVAFNPTAGPYVSSGIRIPRCAGCAGHIEASNSVLLPVLGLVSILVIIVGATNWLPVAILGVLMMCGVGLAYLNIQRKREKMAKDGHHTGLEIAAIPNIVSVRTTNPRLAADVRVLNADLVG